MGSKYTMAQKTASLKYMAEKTESIQLRVKKGKKPRYQEFARQQGKSLNRLVQDLIEEEMKRTGFQ